MRSKSALFLLAAVLFLPFHAIAAQYIDSTGREYISKPVERGVLLKSQDLTIRLNRACRAFSQQYGKGTWAWANGGFVVSFAGNSIAFPRQELDMNNQGACRA
jgi:hypothetical protein